MYFWLGIFCLKQGFKSQRLSYTQILIEYPSLSLFSILFYHTNPSLPRTLPQSSPTSSSTLSWPSPSTCPSLYPSSSCTSRSSPLIGPLGCVTPSVGPRSSSFPSLGATWFCLSIILALFLSVPMEEFDWEPGGNLFMGISKTVTDDFINNARK